MRMWLRRQKNRNTYLFQFCLPYPKWNLAICLICLSDVGALRCVRGRGLSLGQRRVDVKTKESEQIPTVFVDYGFFGQPEDAAHNTLPVLIVRD